MKHSDRVPAALGPYRILEPIGKGGMASVYKAHQPSVDRVVAIKVLPVELAADPTFVGRFDREAKVLAQLEHPHILAVHDSGREGSIFYLVLRYVRGGTLRERIEREGPLPVPELLRIARQVGGALAHAHRRGVLHRDVKSSNVLLDEHGDAFLGDFGLARPLDVTSDLTTSGHVLGTPACMAPEQSLGEDVDARADVYSFGVLLYEMATGQLPFTSGPQATPVAVIARSLRDPPVPPRSLRPDLPPSIDQAILKALEKDRESRHPSIEAMLDALGDRSPATAALEPVRRRRLAVLAAAAVAILGGAAAAVAFLPGVRDRTSVPPATPPVEGPPRPPPPVEGPGWGVHLSPDDVRVVASAGPFVWAGGPGGLVRWRREEAEPTWFRAADGLPSNHVTSLVARADGSIWVGTTRGVAYLDGPTGRWTTYGRDEGLDADLVVHLYDDDGLLWAASVGGERGLDVLVGGRFTPAGVPPLPAEALPALRRVAKDRVGRLWVGLASGGTLRRDGREWRRIEIDGDAGVRDLEIGPRGLLAATERGVYRFANQAGAWTRVLGGDEIDANDVHGSDEERPWVAAEGGIRHGSTFLPSESAEFPGYSVTSVAEDEGGGLWFGMAGAGLSRLSGGKVARRTAGPPGPTLNDLFRVVAGPDGSLWVLPSGRGGVFERRPDGSWIAHSPSTGALADPDVVAFDGLGRTWAAQWGDVRVRDGARWKPFDAEALREEGVDSIASEPDGSMWFGLQSGSILRFDASGTLASRWGRESGLPGEAVNAILLAKDGAALALSGGRLLELAGETWTPASGPDEEARRLAVGPDGTAWAIVGDRLLARGGAGGWRAVAAPRFPLDAIAVATDGRLWALGWGLAATLPPGSAEWEDAEAWPRDLSEEVRDAAVTADGVLWVATTAGLGRYEPPKR